MLFLFYENFKVENERNKLNVGRRKRLIMMFFSAKNYYNYNFLTYPFLFLTKKTDFRNFKLIEHLCLT